MATKDSIRSRVGFGSTYHKAAQRGARPDAGIETILGGQVWMIKPDRDAKAANPCLWMQAGVVKYMNCNNFYDCNTCRYDAAMRKRVEQGKQISWQDAMRCKPELDRVCRHSLTGRIASRACAHDYRCGKCEFDQFFEEVWTARLPMPATELHRVKGFDVPMGHYFHNGHTWARIESGGYIRIGLDDFALKVLGKADAFELPLMGKELDQGAIGWGLRRKDNLADVRSPVDGVIVEVNAKVRENPELSNREPYENGWLFRVRTPDIKGTVTNLMDDRAGLGWINSEVQTLEHMIEEVAGPLAADGGFLQSDVYGNLPDLGWQRLTNTFLKT